VLSLRFSARAAGSMILSLALAASALAGPRQAFRALHGLDLDLPVLVEQLAADLEVAMEIEDPEDGVAYFASSAQAALEAYPDMPGGFRHMLRAAQAAAPGLENPWRARTQYHYSYERLTSHPEPFSAPGPEVFPLVTRTAIRRSHLPALDHGAKLFVLLAALGDLAGASDLHPSALHGLALTSLLEGAAVPAHPAATHLVLSRSAGSIVVDASASGRDTFLRTALEATDEFTPAPLARGILMAFAQAGAQSPHLGEGDRAQLRAASLIAGPIADDAQAVQILRAAIEGLTAIPPPVL